MIFDGGVGGVYFPTPVSDVILLFGVGLGEILNEEEDDSTRSTEIVSVQLVDSIGHTAHPVPHTASLSASLLFTSLLFI